MNDKMVLTLTVIADHCLEVPTIVTAHAKEDDVANFTNSVDRPLRFLWRICPA